MDAGNVRGDDYPDRCGTRGRGVGLWLVVVSSGSLLVINGLLVVINGLLMGCEWVIDD